MKSAKKSCKFYILLSTILLLTVCQTACGSEQNAEEAVVIKQVEVSSGNPLVEEQFSKAVYGDVVKRDLYSGTITPYIEELFFQADGLFLEYCVSIGDSVEEGQVLATTDTEAVEDSIEKLQETIASLKNNYEYRMATIQNNLAILQVEMDINYDMLENMEYMANGYTALCQALGRQDKTMRSYELEMKQLTEVYELELPYYQKKLKETKKLLDSNVITAPFAGVIVELRSVAGGDRVSADQPYVAIADTGKYLAQGTYVSGSVIDKAQRVYVFTDGKEYNAQYMPLDSKVYAEMIAKNNVAYCTYEIEDLGELTFGQTVLIVIQHDSRENVLTIPYTCVKNEGSSRYCYVKRGEEREKVYLETGLFDGMNYEVLSGLKEGDEVIIE